MRTLRNDSGFTLVEILLIVVIVAVLVAIAVPAYLSLTGTAQTTGAKSNVRSAIPAAEHLYAKNGSYAGLSGAVLRADAHGIARTVRAVAVNSNQGYCIQDTENSGSTYYDYVGGSPGSALQTGYSAATIQLASCRRAVGVPAG